MKGFRSATKETSAKKSKSKTRISESESRVNGYLAEGDDLFQRLSNDKGARDKTKAYKARAHDATRDVDRHFQGTS